MLGRNLWAVLFAILQLSFVLCRTTEHPSIEIKAYDGRDVLYNAPPAIAKALNLFPSPDIKLQKGTQKELPNDASFESKILSLIYHIQSDVKAAIMSEDNGVINIQNNSSVDSKVQRSIKLASDTGTKKESPNDVSLKSKIFSLIYHIQSDMRPASISENNGVADNKNGSYVDSKVLHSYKLASDTESADDDDGTKIRNLILRVFPFTNLTDAAASNETGSHENENFKRMDTLQALLSPVMFSGNPDVMLYEGYGERTESDGRYLKNGALIFLGALLGVFMLSFAIIIIIGKTIRTGAVLRRENSQSNEVQQPDQPNPVSVMQSPMPSTLILPGTQSNQPVYVSPPQNQPYITRNSLKVGFPKVKHGKIICDSNSSPVELDQRNPANMEQPPSPHGVTEQSLTPMQSPMASSSQSYQSVNVLPPPHLQSPISRNSLKISLPKIKPGLILSNNNSPPGEFDQQNSANVEQPSSPHDNAEQSLRDVSSQYQSLYPVYQSGQPNELQQPNHMTVMQSSKPLTPTLPSNQSYQLGNVSPSYNQSPITRNSLKISLPKIKPGVILNNSNSPPAGFGQPNPAKLQQPSSPHVSMEQSLDGLSPQFQSLHPTGQQYPPMQMVTEQHPAVIEFHNHMSSETPDGQSPTNMELQPPSPVLEFHNQMSSETPDAQSPTIMEPQPLSRVLEFHNQMQEQP